MTGRDLILYILENHLEDEPVFKDGKFIGFISAGEAAIRMNVGLATVCVLVHEGQLEGELFENRLYIPANFKSPLKGDENNG
jgi:hypothetical protein